MQGQGQSIVSGCNDVSHCIRCRGKVKEEEGEEEGRGGRAAGEIRAHAKE